MTLKLLSTGLMSLALLASGAHAGEIKKGDTLQTLVNLHPDLERNVLYTINYQLTDILPACTPITVKTIKSKKMVFEWEGRTLTFELDKYTKKAGVNLTTVLQDFVGPSCDKAAMAKLSDIDQQGIQQGVALKGMSKKGVLFAMGRPPHHANPNLDAKSWLYWRNRFGKRAIDFDDNGIVTGIR